MAMFELVKEITTAMDNSMSTVAVFIDLKRRLIEYTILGPILFIIYINDMHTVSSLIKCIIFANDADFLYTGNYVSEICKTVSYEPDKLSSWLMANTLSLNVSKANLMIISRKQIVNNPIVSINGINIERVYIATFLSVHIDRQLDWNCHIKSITTLSAKKVSVINRVKHLLNSHALYYLYTTLITLIGNSGEIIIKAEFNPYMLQKKAIRICKHEGYLSHSRPFFFLLF